MWKFLSLITLLVFVSSCASKRKLTYLYKDTIPQTVSSKHTYNIRSGDNLFIQIKSSDPSSSNFYNLNDSDQSGPYNEAFVYLNSHTVSLLGAVKLPFLGDIEVKGLSIPEITIKLENALTEHLKDASVFVKLVSYDVTVIGEVNQPGKYVVYESSEINIFQALGLAGDITNYGKRNTVKIIRNESNGIANTIELDLSSNNVFASEGYNIYPHDIIYVEPRRLRSAEMNLKPIGTFLSGAGVLLLLLRIFQ